MTARRTASALAALAVFGLAGPAASGQALGTNAGAGIRIVSGRGDPGLVVRPPRRTAWPSPVANNTGGLSLAAFEQPADEKAPAKLAMPRQGQVVELTPPPLDPADVPLAINLAAALRLADARPLVVAAAQAGQLVAEAQLRRAEVLWIPNVNLGFDYIRHDGYGPDFNRALNVPQTPTSLGKPLNQNINFFYGGGGVTTYINMTDAIFQPLAARQVLRSRRADVQTAKNNALLMTADSYFDVHMYRGRYAGALEVVDRGTKLADRIKLLATDLVPKVEHDRAMSALADLKEQAASARENWRVSSADLTLVLRLDPRAVVVPTERDHLQVTLIDADRPLDDLIPIGLMNRPELASQQALVRAAIENIQKERMRPRLPNVLLNGFQTPYELIQFGAMGIGSGGKINQWSFRNDISTQLIWQFENFGCGNLARVREQRAEQSRQLVELLRAQDRVAADVTQAQARVQSAAVRVVEAEKALREAVVSFDGNYEGLAQTSRFGDVLVQVFRPQEAVEALMLLKTAYDKYYSTVAEFNKAQFLLFHALGYPAEAVASFKQIGDIEPVDTARPAYLPPVGEGPPPPTR